MNAYADAVAEAVMQRVGRVRVDQINVDDFGTVHLVARGESPARARALLSEMRLEGLILDYRVYSE